MSAVSVSLPVASQERVCCRPVVSAQLPVASRNVCVSAPHPTRLVLVVVLVLVLLLLVVLVLVVVVVLGLTTGTPPIRVEKASGGKSAAIIELI